MDAETAATIWKDVDLSESYLVWCWNEKAAALSSSILKNLHSLGLKPWEDIQVYDMMACAGVVLVQSLNTLGRTSEILSQLRDCFESVIVIPTVVVYFGARFMLAEGALLGLQEFFEEFLGRWSWVDEEHIALVTDADLDSENKCDGLITLEVDHYLEVVEMYVTLLAQYMNNIDLAISWVEKASLPLDKRQILLECLSKLHLDKATGMSQIASGEVLLKNAEASSSVEEPNACKGSPMASMTQQALNSGKEVVLKLSERVEPCLWFFRTITLKFGNARFVIPSWKITLGCLIALFYYIIRKKQASVKRMLSRQMMSLKRGLIDLWQLAFSYQVNPLAAVQPFSTTAHRSE